MLVGKSDSVRRVRKRVTCVDTWDERAPSFEMPSRCPSASCQSISGPPGSDECSLARYWTRFGAGSAELVWGAVVVGERGCKYLPNICAPQQSHSLPNINRRHMAIFGMCRTCVQVRHLCRAWLQCAALECAVSIAFDTSSTATAPVAGIGVDGGCW